MTAKKATPAPRQAPAKTAAAKKAAAVPSNPASPGLGIQNKFVGGSK